MKLNSIEVEHIEALGEKYPLTMNLNVYSALQEEFGDLDSWYDKIFGKKEAKKDVEPSIAALIFTVKEMINEGIDIENELKPGYREHISTTIAGAICTEIGVSEVQSKIQTFEKSEIGENMAEEGDSPRTD